MKNSITYEAIGVIYSEHTVPENTPIQPIYAQERNGWQDDVDEPTAQQRGKRGFQA
jgi:hypothetical protein